MARSTLRCPVSGERLIRKDGRFVNRSGLYSYPELAGVPLLVQHVSLKKRPDPPPLLVMHALLKALDLPDEALQGLIDVFSHDIGFEEKWMQAEADQFLFRVAASHPELTAALQESGWPSPSDQHQHQHIESSEVNVAPWLCCSTPFFPEVMAPGEQISVNVRVRNVGECAVSSDGECPVFLSYQWAQDGVAVGEGLRTALLIDLKPDQAMTVPVLLKAPDVPGDYGLTILPVHETVQWLHQGGCQANVLVESGYRRPPLGWRQTAKVLAYGDDHDEALRLLSEWRGRYISRKRARILEIGGNCHPMVSKLNPGFDERFNLDLDPFGMAVGSNFVLPFNEGVRFVVADGFRLPFGHRRLDVITLFASFHHFPDPLAFLQSLTPYLTRQGLVCLMCEPVGHVSKECIPDEYRNELLKGVNEQSFILREYAVLFEKAGFDVVDCQVDQGSLKVALRPKIRPGLRSQLRRLLRFS